MNPKERLKEYLDNDLDPPLELLIEIAEAEFDDWQEGQDTHPPINLNYFNNTSNHGKFDY